MWNTSQFTQVVYTLFLLQKCNQDNRHILCIQHNWKNVSFSSNATWTTIEFANLHSLSPFFLFIHRGHSTRQWTRGGRSIDTWTYCEIRNWIVQQTSVWVAAATECNICQTGHVNSGHWGIDMFPWIASSYSPESYSIATLKECFLFTILCILPWWVFWKGLILAPSQFRLKFSSFPK